jgi:hypothetical protein
VPEATQAPWRAFGDELGLLFQIVDDILDGDGYVVTPRRGRCAPPRGRGCASARSGCAGVRPTRRSRDIVDGLATRTSCP